MANIKSSKKSIRKIAKLTMRNKAEKSRIKTASKKLKTLRETGDAEAIKVAAKALMSIVDKAGKHGVWHDNKVNRIKSRLTPLIVGTSSKKSESASEVIPAEPSAVEDTEAVESVEDKAANAETTSEKEMTKTASKEKTPAKKDAVKKASSKKPTTSKTKKTSSKASE